RDFGEVRLGDFDVVAEDGVEADLERANAGALALARLDLHEDRLRAVGNGPVLYELGVDAGLDRAAVAEVERRGVVEGGEDERNDVVEGHSERRRLRGIPC